MNIMGLDLSLRGAGIVVIPADWVERGAPLAELHSWRVDGGKLARDADERQKAERDEAIGLRVWRFAHDHRVKHAFVEDYAFSKNNNAATGLHELGGVVRHKLIIGLGVDVERVTASAARKLMFGTIKRSPQKGYIKNYVGARLAEMSLSRESEDENDALVIANYGLAFLSQRAFTAPEGGR